METFSLAAVQMNALKNDLEHNIEVHCRISREAAGACVKLVLFPELGVTAHYGDPQATALAQEATDGSIYQTISSLARELNIFISYGFCEKAHGTYYNSQALVGPKGMIGVQRKVHASLDEYLYFRMGRSLEVFDLGFCRVGILVCFDSMFFEAWRILALKEAEVLLLPHASRCPELQKTSDQEQLAKMHDHLRRAQNHRSVCAGGKAESLHKRYPPILRNKQILWLKDRRLMCSPL